MTEKPAIAFIGPGKVGCALAAHLQEKGFKIIGAVIREGGRTEGRPGQEVFPALTSDWSSLLPEARLIFITTPDDQIAPIARDLRQKELIDQDTVLVHTSGHHPASIMGERNVLAMHPLLSMARWDLARDNLGKAWFFLDGDKRGLAWGEKICRALELNWEIIPGEKKGAYHAGAVIFSNYLVALVNAGLELHKKAGIGEEAALSAALPLVESTLTNLRELGPTEALTGPVARGDLGTVQGHLQILDGEEQLDNLYRALAGYTLEIARKKGLSEGTYWQMKKYLEEGTDNG